VLSDGRFAFLGTNDVVYLFNANPEVTLQHTFFDKYGYLAPTVAASPGIEPLLAVAGKSGLAIYSCNEFKKVFKFSGNILSIDWSPSGRYLSFILAESNEKLAAYCLDVHREKIATRISNSEGACLLSFSPFENFLIIGIKAEKPGKGKFIVMETHNLTQTAFEINREADELVSLSSVVWTRDELYFLAQVEDSNYVHLFGRNCGRLFKDEEREELL